MRCWRPSPGVVQRRRRRGAGKLSVRGPLWAVPEGWLPEQEAGSGRGRAEQRVEVAARLHGAMREGAVAIVSRGARMGNGRQKCLQASVAGLLRRGRRDQGVSYLRRAAGNNDGSGASGTLREQFNFSDVERALRVSDTCVHVLESSCMQTLEQGEASGCWCLGARAAHLCIKLTRDR